MNALHVTNFIKGVSEMKRFAMKFTDNPNINGDVFDLDCLKKALQKQDKITFKGPDGQPLGYYRVKQLVKLPHSLDIEFILVEERLR